jgi:hypothetical protein
MGLWQLCGELPACGVYTPGGHDGRYGHAIAFFRLLRTTSEETPIKRPTSSKTESEESGSDPCLSESLLLLSKSRIYRP